MRAAGKHIPRLDQCADIVLERARDFLALGLLARRCELAARLRLISSRVPCNASPKKAPPVYPPRSRTAVSRRRDRILIARSASSSAVRRHPGGCKVHVGFTNLRCNRSRLVRKLSQLVLKPGDRVLERLSRAMASASKKQAKHNPRMRESLYANLHPSASKGPNSANARSAARRDMRNLPKAKGRQTAKGFSKNPLGGQAPRRLSINKTSRPVHKSSRSTTALARFHFLREFGPSSTYPPTYKLISGHLCGSRSSTTRLSVAISNDPIPGRSLDKLFVG